MDEHLIVPDNMDNFDLKLPLNRASLSIHFGSKMSREKWKIVPFECIEHRVEWLCLKTPFVRQHSLPNCSARPKHAPNWPFASLKHGRQLRQPNRTQF